MRTAPEVRAVLEAERQLHILPLVADAGSPAFAQLVGANLPGLRARLAKSLRAGEAERAVEPFPGVCELGSLPAEERAALFDDGCRLIARGALAVLLLAGGQGTRLGSSAPKGCYDIGMPSGKSLFQYHAERLLRVRQLAAAAAGVDVSTVRLPLAVMTSDATHEATSRFFAEHAHFGLPPADVHFFEQGMLPCLSLEGEILVEGAGRVAMAPDGNGGVYSSLLKSGLLDKLETQGVTSFFQLCVDNALCRLADPMFVGYCVREGAECASKTVPKAHAHERVGVLGLQHGRACVFEYSEIDAVTAEAVDSKTGNLLFGTAHICVNWFALAFVRRIATDPSCALPLHVARKTASIYLQYLLNHDLQPGACIKLEMFIFDAFFFAKKMVALQVPREDEFAPVKNAPGSVTDSPDTARALLSAWAERRVPVFYYTNRLLLYYTTTSCSTTKT
ncbi:nucleotide-diphospho-sugar transferase [Pavlovales sp. CCMP2436]|nr:nucleotide-diphospho-sugar transferase [Pavlovales sp. CCMP2436]